jgi:NADPH-dependent ferric siderophore reductase
VAAATLPPGRGRVYLAGEVGLVAALRRALQTAGLEFEWIAAKGYLNLGRANMFIGEPEQR